MGLNKHSSIGTSAYSSNTQAEKDHLKKTKKHTQKSACEGKNSLHTKPKKHGRVAPFVFAVIFR